MDSYDGMGLTTYSSCCIAAIKLTFGACDAWRGTKTATKAGSNECVCARSALFPEWHTGMARPNRPNLRAASRDRQSQAVTLTARRVSVSVYCATVI